MIFYLALGFLLRIFDGGVLQIIAFVSYYLIFPVIASQGAMPYRLMMVASGMLGIMITEVVVTSIWMRITGLPISEYYSVLDHFGPYLFVRLMAFAIMATCFIVIRFAVAHVLGEGEGLRFFAGFVLSQALLLAAAWLIVEAAGVGSDELCASGCALCVVCIATDSVMLASLDRYGKKQSDKRRAIALKQQLDWCIGRYDGIVCEIERTARMRHDLRNQLRVAILLVERGNIERACDHIGRMRQAVECDDTEYFTATGSSLSETGESFR